MKRTIHSARPFFIILIFLCISIFQLKAQNPGTRKALMAFEKAQDYFQNGEWVQCESELKKAIIADSTLADPYIMLGDVYLETERPEDAVVQYKKSLKLNPKRVEIVYNLLANTLYSLERYGEAVEYYEDMLNVQGLDQELRASIELKYKISKNRKALMDNPVAFDPVNLGPSVNTRSDEYINTLAADGSGIYFTRKTKNTDGQFRQFSEDFYFSQFNGDSLVNAVLLDYPPGKTNDAGALCLSPDGRMLFFTACYRPDSYGSCDLYYSEKKGDSWSTVKNLGPAVNSSSWDAQPSISPDGRTLFFVSSRRGGLGNSDIWKSDKMPDGNWGKPVNLGAPVNTPSEEMAPFIHYDNQTLYFSSAGHQGLGGTDLFKSTRNNNQWSEPENLGYPINSKADELVVIVNTVGDQGYISSNSLSGAGGYDIFRFELYEAIRPVPVTYLKGKVYDKVTGLPLEARFELIDLELDSTITQANSDRQNGEFLVCLPCNRNYALNVSCKGYLFYSENFPLLEIKSRLDPVLKDVPLEPIAEGKTMVLRNIFFETDQYQLKSTSFAELDKLTDFLVANPDLRVEIGGHTDNEGTEAYNLELSTRRAESVYNYLLEHGINAGRITYKGYGEGQPVSSNDSEEGRAQNRRTEITVLGKE